MPQLPHACSCGCGTVITGRGKCASSTREVERRRGSRHERGYGAEWDRDSRHFRKLYPYCGMRPNGEAPVMSKCHNEGIVTLAYQTDHVVPHRGDPALFMDRSLPVAKQPNWQSLCQECGARKSQAGL